MTRTQSRRSFFLATAQGQLWIEEKRRARRPDPGPPPWTIRTKFPFVATINGEEMVVWPDWIERLGTPLYEPDYEEDFL